MHPAICEGQPTVRGLAIPVWQVLNWLAATPSEAAVLAAHPELEADDLRACLVFAAQRLRHFGSVTPSVTPAEPDEWLRMRQSQWLAEQEFLRQLWERRPPPYGPESAGPANSGPDKPVPPARQPLR